MHFRILGLALLLLSNLTLAAPGRAPAVEDFVGIEVDQIPSSPSDENLFNLEQDLGKIEVAGKSGPIEVAATPTSRIAAPEETPWSFSKVLAVLFILSLPLISWLHVLNHMRNKASVESASNIEVLEKYRLEREQTKNKKDDIKKAS